MEMYTTVDERPRLGAAGTGRFLNVMIFYNSSGCNLKISNYKKKKRKLLSVYLTYYKLLPPGLIASTYCWGS
jgi:hypothetical protein